MDRLFSKLWWIVAAIVLIVGIVTVQRLFLGDKHYLPDGPAYTHYNNFVIFRQSFFHLVNQQDLYRLYPEEHWDLYKYSPTFSLLMAPLAVLPDSMGLLGWNLLNVLVLFFALWKLPMGSPKMRVFAFAFGLIELITSIQNAQSNGLMAGLIIFAMVFLERRQVGWASLMIVLTVFIKIFGLVAFALFLFYPDKWRAAAYTAMWFVVLGLAPLVVVPWSQLAFLYDSWAQLLQQDKSVSFGISIAGFLHGCFGIDARNAILLLGAALFCVPLLRIKLYADLRFRLLFLAAVLLWIVIFNHKAESPTYVIAIAGVGIWFFGQARSRLNWALLILALILTVLSPTDIFPRSIRTEIVVPLALKAVPCILIWLKVMWELMTLKAERALA